MKWKIFPILFCAVILFVSSQTTYAEKSEKYVIETIAENLEIPWSIAFAPDDRIFVTERIGKLRVIQDGQLKPEPLATLNVGAFEGGLLGIALDPNFNENHYIYLYYTYSEFLITYNKVVRYIENGNGLEDGFVLLDKIPGAAIHDGGRLRFGPDGKLYITTGDAASGNSAQDLNSLAGKILRINPDGTIPDDNPFENSPVFSYGHRNPQGLDWDPVSGKLVAVEHGSNARDEVNVVEAGKNYGWPIIVGNGNDPNYVDPILHTGTETWAPSGASFYTSDKIPEWENKFFVATLRGKHLRVLDFDLQQNKVLSSDALFSNEFGRLRDAVVGPDGYLYLLTSNRDGRGSPAPNDDRVLRISVEEDHSFLTPLKQTKSGIDPKDVDCKQGMMLLLKSGSGKPVCVTQSTASKFIASGWGSKV